MEQRETNVRMGMARWLIALACGGAPLAAQTRILPLGDSITNGGQGYVSYRYDLWFDLLTGGYAVDFVGSRNELFAGSQPIPALYPLYDTTFDRDHEGYWGWRTDQIDSIVSGLVQAAQPDIVLIHLGSNDVGQSGAAGVANADFYLRSIIGRVRGERPNVVILLAQIIPFGPGTSYSANAASIPPLNAAIATIAADLSTPQSPIVLVDHNTGYDLNTMMQSDGLHPNELGEAFQSGRWQAALTPFLTAGNIPPAVALTSPADGQAFVAPQGIALTATASDADGQIVQVRFFDGGAQLAADSTPPYEFYWTGAALGLHTLTAEAEDDEGATRVSAAVTIRVDAPGDWTPIAIANPSFETPLLSDGNLAQGPGVIGGWTFTQTPATYTGIFNPPSGSYSSAAGNSSPIGADGANVAYLFKNGAGQSVELTQALPAAALEAGREYRLRVAIGRFLPNQPYAFSTYGGYRLELLAGGTLIASDSDSILPPVGEFAQAQATVASDGLPPALLGQALSLRFTISAMDSPRSSHFDDVRLEQRSTTPPAAGDLDADGDVDAADGLLMLDCVNGPDMSLLPGCGAGDLDADGDVDLGDVADMQVILTP